MATNSSIEMLGELLDAAQKNSKAHKFKDVDIVHAGDKITLPANPQEMGIKEGIAHLQRKLEAEEKETAVYHEIQCSPLDGFVAFNRALSNKYGWVEGVPTPGFFGDKPPTMLSIPVGINETVQAPFGRIQVPGIDGYLETSYDISNPKFIIKGAVKKKHTRLIDGIAQLTKEFLKKESIYKGKAVRVSFAYERDDDRGYHPTNDAPKFFDISGVNEDGLIFGEEVQSALNVGLFTPIEYSDACRQHSIPLKRGILLHGPFGTGKSMTAAVTALKAVRNGWTFVYLDNILDLKSGLRFAAQYAPCVVFAEDIDRSIKGERSLEMDEVLNIMDGIDTKGSEIITVFTTNHVEDINPAMLRPGRLDVLIEVSPPDADAAQKLVKLYARELLEKGADLSKIGLRLAGKIPAVIREVVERAKISAIYRIGSGEIKGKVKEADLLSSADAMENHTKMLQPKPDKDAAHTLLIAIPNRYEPASVEFVADDEVPQVVKAVNAHRDAKKKVA